jgi:hypothetical protein
MKQQPTRRSPVTAVGVAAVASASPTPSAGSAGATPEVAYRTAGELLKALADRRASSRELVNAAIARIEALDPKINAVVPGRIVGRVSRGARRRHAPPELGPDIGGSFARRGFAALLACRASHLVPPARRPPQTPEISVRSDLAIGPRLSAADLALQRGASLDRTEWADGIGYKPALPPRATTSWRIFARW